MQSVVESDQSPADKLRNIIRIQVASEIENVNIAAAVIFESRAVLDMPDVRQQYVMQRDTLEALYRAVVEQGIAEGVFVVNDVGIFIKTLFGALNWVSLWYREDGRLSGAEIASEIAQTFLRALGADR